MMTSWFAVFTQSDGTYYTEQPSLQELARKIDNEEEVKVVWFTVAGKRCTEDFVFYDKPKYIRSESEMFKC